MSAGATSTSARNATTVAKEMSIPNHAALLRYEVAKTAKPSEGLLLSEKILRGGLSTARRGGGKVLPNPEPMRGCDVIGLRARVSGCPLPA